ncbi:unnamed protein product [Angiostrongylus costaricensis]|uniref:RICTOR_N domain-containing protein n=1 Tax=Angiostrongylus costaricensis TaxID=334426 RepID=A0A0R3PY06_ANGCS|nr:unnamed protein product [Angiostrongylus costaricensis]
MHVASQGLINSWSFILYPLSFVLCPLSVWFERLWKSWLAANALIFRLSLACFEVFLEFCVLEPELILNMAGTDWMVRVLMGASVTSRGVASVVAHILVSWLDRQSLREKGKLHLVLEVLINTLRLANFCAFDRAAMHNFSHSFLCILRSWAGLFSCAAIGPNSTVIPSSPFRLLEYLGLGTVDDSNISRIRDMIVDICCDFMDVPYASMVFESWPKSVIIVESLEFQSLARLIVSQPDSASGLKATLFLSDILRMATAVMPSGWRSAMNSMPTLVQSACETLAQSKAAAAIHGYYDPNYADRFTFLNSENAAMVLYRFDTLNKIWIANECAEPAADSIYSLFLRPPKLFSSPLRAFCGEVIDVTAVSDALTFRSKETKWILCRLVQAFREPKATYAFLRRKWIQRKYSLFLLRRLDVNFCVYECVSCPFV